MSIVFDLMAPFAQCFQIAGRVVVAVPVDMMDNQETCGAAAFTGILTMSPICLDAAFPVGIVFSDAECSLAFRRLQSAETLTRTSARIPQATCWNFKFDSTLFAKFGAILAVPASLSALGGARSRTETPDASTLAALKSDSACFANIGNHHNDLHTN